MQDSESCPRCGSPKIVLEVASRDGGLVGVRIPGGGQLLPLLASTCGSCGHASLFATGFAALPAHAAAVPVATHPTGGAPYRDALPSAVDVVLVHAGTNKIGVIRVLREVFKWDLRVAKDIAERPMSVLAARVSTADAIAIRAKIVEEGGTVELKPC